MKLSITAVFTLAITTASFADIYQYSDCDGNGTLLLTELNAEPFVDLSGLYLGCANLTHAILYGADLHGADLIDADLTGANLYSADLTYADLTYAALHGANLIDADLTGAILYGADLTYADLTYAALTVAILSNADLTNADLTYADLYGANLTNADLTGAYNWQSSTWTGATYNDATVFPDGMNPEKYGMIYADLEGACCVTSGCDVMEEAMCTNLGGTWTEAGSCDDCVAPPETCDADLDGDGEVDIADLLALIAAWGVCP